jgi:hypothetical protein
MDRRVIGLSDLGLRNALVIEAYVGDCDGNEALS